MKASDLEKEIERLRRENEKLKEELEKTEDKLKKTEKEFKEFKAKHATTVENLKKAMKIKANSTKKLKKKGAKEGHQGYARHIPERIDYVKPLNPKKCPDCNAKLTSKTQEIRSRHVTDIKLTSKVIHTRYDIHRKYCTNCKKIVEPKVPNVLPHARFGLNLMLLIMYLKIGLRLPCNKVCDFLSTMYNLQICEAEIIVVLKQLNKAYGGYYKYLEKLVKLARVKYTDSTSWRVNGKNYYAWVFVTCGVVLYRIRKRNNLKTPLGVFGKKQHGNIVVVDRHSTCRALAEAAGLQLQLCWSHILQDSKELARDFGPDGKYVHKRLKQIYELATSLDHKGTGEMIEQLKGEICQLTSRRYKRPTVWKFVQNLFYRDVENLFRFVSDPEIDPTNNISERELRALVIIRKISNGSRSRNGANITATLLSVIQTLRFKNKNVLLGMKDILNNPSGY